MICAFVSGKKEQDDYVRYFADSIRAKLIRTPRNFSDNEIHLSDMSIQYNFRENFRDNSKGVIFAGLLRGNAHVLKSSITQKIDFYYVDHAYFNSGYKFPNWMRVTKNGFAQNLILQNINFDKVKKFNFQFKDYNFRNKQNIVLFPPSNTVERVFNQQDWETKTIKNIREYTDRPIIVRRKNGPIMDKFMIDTIGKEKYHYDESLDEVLDNAYCIVTFNSSVALKALEKGIPVICDHFCPAYPLTHKFEEIENLEEKERFNLFASLASGQFTKEEIKQKSTFNYINSIIQWEGKLL